MSPTRPVQYQVWSTLPPALVHGRIVGGTIEQVYCGTTRLNPHQPLPAGTTLAQLHWMPRRVLGAHQEPTTKTVPGSKGKTYLVTTHASGRMTCTCPGYTYRRTCKHLAG